VSSENCKNPDFKKKCREILTLHLYLETKYNKSLKDGGKKLKIEI